MKEELGDLDKVISPEVDSKVWSFLHTRVSLLLKAYETSIEVNDIDSPRYRVCAIYSTPLGCYGKLIRSDQFIHLVR